MADPFAPYRLVEPENPILGQFALRLQIPKQGSTKKTYRVYEYDIRLPGAPPKWRMTYCFLEWLPRAHTWRLRDSYPSRQLANGSRMTKKTTLADFGNVTEEEACTLALSTLSLSGY